MGNEEKVTYLLGLLGRKKVIEDSDSDYEDIVENNLQQKLTMIDDLKTTPQTFTPRATIITDDYTSDTTIAQEETELLILDAYKQNQLRFLHTRHLNYILRSLTTPLPHYYNSLDANHPWMLYWLYNSYNLIETTQSEAFLPKDTVTLINDKIERCIVNDGLDGIAGGANQLGHVAATYAAILALVSTKHYLLLDQIKDNLYQWFMSLKVSNGSFIMHKNGESDTRSTYCVLVVASLLNIVTPELTENTLEWLNKTQTYEGGFAGIPDTEAHGGYAFCALASYFLLFENKLQFDSASSFNLESLIRWSVLRQFELEGGFSGRSNKLVDACYSFWIGAVFPLLETITGGDLFDREGLRHYILRCAQNETGGFRDKPGKSVDFYHTNYTLAGLSVCEHKTEVSEEGTGPLAFRLRSKPRSDIDIYTVPLNPVFGLPQDLVIECQTYFGEQ